MRPAAGTAGASGGGAESGSSGNPLAETLTVAPEDAPGALGSRREGLSAAEADVQRSRFGPNVVPRTRGISLPRQLAAQLTHIFALMLWAASGLAFAAGMPQLAWAVMAVIVINAAFTFLQEYRAERATRAMAALLPARATVLRHGRKREILAADLVPGDVLLLREGDRISADARVIESHGLKVDNSTLTGESLPVERFSRAMPVAPREVLEADNSVFAGTHVTSGSAVAVVAATGGATRFGGIARLTGEVVRRPSPLRLQLHRAVRVVGIVAVVAGAAFFSIASSMGIRTAEAFVFALGVIVALIPEGLLPTFTLSLAMGAQRMAGRGALVRNLEAVEALGCTTVICTDKTGTITQNEMTVTALVTPAGRFTVSGSGYDPSGAILAAGGRPLSEPERADVAPLLHAAALCGDARVLEQGGRWSCSGDPTEAALLVLARKGGVTREDEERRAPRIREFPFESGRQRMSTVHVLVSGCHEVLAKGSPEAILPRCTSVRLGRTTLPLGPAEERAVLAGSDSLAVRGLRVLAVARREVSGPAPATAAEAEAGMELLGLVGMADPVRPEVPDAIARCRRAGIQVVMITGDHPATAMTVAREAGIPAHTVMLPAELPADDAALGNILGTHVCVLARVTPEEKLRIARALQGRGEVVAMTGDGVNDAPALRKADIGVAMGRSGTDVAREAADLVLLDDNFAHIVEAIEEGRAAFDNMKRFLTYVLTSNVPELVPFLAWALSGGTIPLAITVMQILAIDLVTDLLPALALGAERPSPDVMSRAPRPRAAKLLDAPLLARAYGFLGPLEAAISMAMLPLGAALFMGWTPGRALPTEEARLLTLSTMVWCAIVLTQVGNGFACRSRSLSLRRIGPFSNRLLLVTVGVEVAAMLLFVYVPVVGRVLGTRPLRLVEWLPLLAAPLALLGAEEARKLLVRRRGPARRERLAGGRGSGAGRLVLGEEPQRRDVEHPERVELEPLHVGLHREV